jgi:hypothetical protein
LTLTARAAIASRSTVPVRIAVAIHAAIIVAVAGVPVLTPWGRKCSTWWRWNRWATFAWKIGQLTGRTVALAEFIRHVKNLSYGGNPTPCALGSPCRGAVRTAPLALARSCVYRNLVLERIPTAT